MRDVFCWIVLKHYNPQNHLVIQMEFTIRNHKLLHIALTLIRNVQAGVTLFRPWHCMNTILLKVLGLLTITSLFACWTFNSKMMHIFYGVDTLFSAIICSREFVPIQQQVHWLGLGLEYTKRSGVCLPLQFSSKVSSGVDDQALCRPFVFFHTSFGKACFIELTLCTGKLSCFWLENVLVIICIEILILHTKTF